VSECVGS